MIELSTHREMECYLDLGVMGILEASSGRNFENGIGNVEEKKQETTLQVESALGPMDFSMLRVKVGNTGQKVRKEKRCWKRSRTDQRKFGNSTSFNYI